MKTSLLIYATCFIVTGCSAQFRFPSLSSALSSLTGFGGSSASSQNGAQATPTSPYSGLVRDYGRNLMMAMSSIYPTLFKPPQQQQQAQQAPQSPFEAFGNQFGSQNLFSGQSPSFSFGGSTFSISPSLPFGSISGANGPSPSQSQPMASASHPSPFGASFGSSINTPASFGSLSSSPFMGQQFAPASSYSAAFEAANGGPSLGGPSSASAAAAASAAAFEGLRSSASLQPSASAMIPQSSNSHSSSLFSSSIPSFSGPHDSSSSMNLPSQNQASQQQHQSGHPSSAFGSPQASQFAPQHYRPDVMSLSASSPISSANSFANYGNIPSSPSGQQMSPSRASYQQPSFR